MKKKKYQEKLLDQTEGQLLNVEDLIRSIENAVIQKKVLDCFEMGTKTLKELSQEMSIDRIELLMEETQEAMAYQDQIAQTLSGKLNNQDDESINAEIDAMMAHYDDSVIDQLKKLPDAPIGKNAEELKQKKKERTPIASREKVVVLA